MDLQDTGWLPETVTGIVASGPTAAVHAFADELEELASPAARLDIEAILEVYPGDHSADRNALALTWRLFA